MVVGAVALIWPQIRRIGSLHDMRPAEADEPHGFPVDAAAPAARGSPKP